MAARIDKIVISELAATALLQKCHIDDYDVAEHFDFLRVILNKYGRELFRPLAQKTQLLPRVVID